MSNDPIINKTIGTKILKKERNVKIIGATDVMIMKKQQIPRRGAL
jgi:hypothetical protein